MGDRHPFSSGDDQVSGKLRTQYLIPLALGYLILGIKECLQLSILHRPQLLSYMHIGAADFTYGKQGCHHHYTKNVVISIGKLKRLARDPKEMEGEG